MKFKKLLSVAICAALVLSTLTGCGQKAADAPKGEATETTANAETNITFWHSMGGVNGEALTYLVDKLLVVEEIQDLQISQQEKVQ